jgi:hypothetical protein
MLFQQLVTCMMHTDLTGACNDVVSSAQENPL